MKYTLSLSDQELTRYREMADYARRHEADAWRRAGLIEGARVADIGCGPAVILCELARIIGPGGHIDGVERDPDARALATALLDREGIGNARIVDGLATSSGLEPGAYDVVMMRHVLVHNGGAEGRILAHLAELLRPGGHLYLVETDLSAVRRVPDDADLQDMERRWLEMLRGAGCDVAVGARLRHLIKDAGLDLTDADARFDVFSRTGNRPPEWAARDAMIRAGLADEGDARRWEEALSRMDRDGRDPIVFVPMFRATGRRRPS